MEGLLSLFSGEKVVMRTKSIVFTAVAGVLLASSASAEGLQHCKRPLIARIAFTVLEKQPTLVQSVPAPRKPL